MIVRTSYGRLSAARPNVPDLPEPYQTLLNETFDTFVSKLPRNNLKNRYYYQKNSLKDMGISIPPIISKNPDYMAVIEWPSTACDALAVRSRFDGFVGAGAEEANAIFELSHIQTKYPMLVTSELISSCSFASISRGTNTPARISLYSALNAGAIWDYENDRILAGLTVVDVDTSNVPTAYNLFTDDAIIYLHCDKQRRWSYEIMKHAMGQPLFVAFVNQPSLDRPFGKSIISRAIMSITDEAVRESIRGSVASEFSVAPQKYILGAPEGFDEIPAWQAWIGSILALTRDENNDLPQVGQFSQGDVQHHITLMRNLASRMSGASSVPVHSLGVINDNNPESAEAMRNAERGLTIKATALNKTNGDSLKLLGQMAVAVANNVPLSALSPAQLDITPKFLSPAFPDPISLGDAVLKTVSAFPQFADSQVWLEMLGMDEATIRRLMSDKRRSEASNAIQALNAAYGGGTDAEQESV